MTKKKKDVKKIREELDRISLRIMRMQLANYFKRNKKEEELDSFKVEWNIAFIKRFHTKEALREFEKKVLGAW